MKGERGGRGRERGEEWNGERKRGWVNEEYGMYSQIDRPS